jgi:protein-S-isoprenylcysteine O-methyltransferase Ste14
MASALNDRRRGTFTSAIDLIYTGLFFHNALVRCVARGADVATNFRDEYEAHFRRVRRWTPKRSKI